MNNTKSLIAVAVMSLGLTLLLSLEAKANGLLVSLNKLEKQYLSLGGNRKAFQQLRCFITRHGADGFSPKPVGGEIAERCNAVDRFSIINDRGVALIDLTKLSNKPRFFVFDFKAGAVRAFYTAHGRYGETPRSNKTVKTNPPGNSILRAVYFSDVPGMNASVGGFFLTAEEYKGMYGRSMVMHGLERDVNDNACVRATVVHKSSYISDQATRLMSSGCPMVAPHRLNYIVDTLKDGALMYIFTPVEAALSDDVCGRNLWLAPEETAPPEGPAPSPVDEDAGDLV